jgi:pre-mRNA-processing factor 17
MDILGNYGSDSDSDNGDSKPTSGSTSLPHSLEYKPMSSALCAAPLTHSLTHTHTHNHPTNSQLIQQNQIEFKNNPRINIVLAPQQGPAHPFRFNAPTPGLGRKQAGMGHVENTNMEAWTFDEQYQTFQRSGYAIDSETNAILGDYKEYVSTNGDTAQTARGKVCSILSFAHSLTHSLTHSFIHSFIHSFLFVFALQE